MPRYFFTIHGRAKIEDDPAGTYLPDVAAALSYAEYTIRELLKKSGYTYNNDPTLMMIVKDEGRQTVLSLPFFPCKCPNPAASRRPGQSKNRTAIMPCAIMTGSNACTFVNSVTSDRMSRACHE